MISSGGENVNEQLALCAILLTVGKEANEPVVSTAHRAPLIINLLAPATKDGCDLMWK